MLTGETLKAIRAIKGITQAQLALESGVSAAGIAEFETGKRDIRASTIVRMCEAMDVTVTYKVNGVDVTVVPDPRGETPPSPEAIAAYRKARDKEFRAKFASITKTPPRVSKSDKG